MVKLDWQVDMHLHTTASDGTWSAEQLLKNIIEKNIKVFSITDHDSTYNSLKIIPNIPEDICYVIGVEICCTYNHQEYHITAYNFDHSNEELQELLTFNILQKTEFDIKVIQYIKEINKIDDIEDFSLYEYNKARGGWNSLNYLLDKGVVKDMRDYFEMINGSNHRLSFKSPKEVIDIIRRAGGHSFLAHPSSYEKGEILPIEILEEFRDYGISGIECFSPYLKNIEDADYYINFCKENDLMISAGSDCHGEFNNRNIGVPKVTMDQVSLDFIRF